KAKLKLTIKNAKPQEDTGTYSVRVKDVESDKISVTVSIKPLKFVKQLKANKTNLVENETVEFTCELSRPLSDSESLSLLLNGQPLSIEEDNNELLIDGTKVLFRISELQPVMSGDYQLVITGDDDREPVKSDVVKLAVKPEQVKFTTPLRALKNPLEENETLVLECELDKPTYKNVIFKHKDVPVSIDNDRIKIKQDGQKWQLYVDNV
ncbi:unnamed protein product, partial [Didymodactylos carnosus]